MIETTNQQWSLSSFPLRQSIPCSDTAWAMAKGRRGAEMDLRSTLDAQNCTLKKQISKWVSENSVPLHPMVLLIIIPTKWL